MEKPTIPSLITTVVESDGAPFKGESGALSNDPSTKQHWTQKVMKKLVQEKKEKKRKSHEAEKDGDDQFLAACIATAKQEKKALAKQVMVKLRKNSSLTNRKLRKKTENCGQLTNQLRKRQRRRGGPPPRAL